MVKEYTQSVIELLQAGEKPEAILRGLRKTLESRGHTSLHARILTGVLRKLSSGDREEMPVVTLAKETDKKKFTAAIKDALSQLDADVKNAEFREDESITGGFIVSYKHNLIDASYKTKLRNWYKRAVSSI